MAAFIDFHRHSGRPVFLSTFSLAELEVESDETDLFDVEPVDTEDTGIQEDMILATATTESISWAKLLLTQTLPAMGLVLLTAWAVYNKLDAKIDSSVNDVMGRITLSENRILESIKALDNRVQSFQSSASDNDRQLLREMADLRVRQVQLESR